MAVDGGWIGITVRLPVPGITQHFPVTPLLACVQRAIKNAAVPCGVLVLP